MYNGRVAAENTFGRHQKCSSLNELIKINFHFCKSWLAASSRRNACVRFVIYVYKGIVAYSADEWFPDDDGRNRYI